MDKYWEKLAYTANSIDDCENERLSRIGAIQDCSYLVALSKSDTTVVAISENAVALLGEPVEATLGKRVDSLSLDLTELDLRTPPRPGEKRFFRTRSASGDTIRGHFFSNENTQFLEMETPQTGRTEAVDELERRNQQLLQWVPSNSDLVTLMREAVEQLRDFTGFDRVMAYQFEPNGDGYVTAESKLDRLEPFEGLRYPASDIPANARSQIYAGGSRSIVDTHSLPAALVTIRGMAPVDIDLNAVAFRASSPFHIQYLKNMGVRASFTLPLRVGDELWGLITCHHSDSPKRVGLGDRGTVELFGQLLASKIQNLLETARLTTKNQVLQLSQKVLSGVVQGRTPTLAFRQEGEGLLSITNSTGVAVKLGEDVLIVGECPDRKVIDAIYEFLQTKKGLSLWSTRRSTDDGIPFDPASVGVLAVPLSLGFQDYVMWFRPSAKQTITWGGRPKGLDSEDTDPKDLSPRASFAKWEQTIEDQSLEWGPEQLDSAQYLLFSFVRDIFAKAGELARTNQKLGDLARSKDEFISMISHELRTPLNAIVGWIEVLKDDESLSEEATQAVATLERNAQAQVILINDLLDISRIASGKLRIDLKREVDLTEIVNDVVRDLSPTASMRSITVTVNAEKGCTASVDPDRWRQVVWNLLSNAIKFNQRNGKIVVEMSKLASTYQMTVSDTGRGIAPEELPRVFEQFAQESMRPSRSSGLGLGLSIVKALVELHGGSVSASSQGRGKGAVFTVSLPIFALDLEPPSFSESEDLDRSTTEGQQILKGLRILIVEDQEDALRALEKTLTRQGATVDSELDGKAGFATYSVNTGEKAYDLILSDIGLPDWDGYRFIREIRSLEQARRIPPVPALALTAFAASADRLACLKAGFQNHLPKPINKEELLYLIQTTLDLETD